MKKYWCLIYLAIFCVSLYSQETYRTRVFNTSVKTLRVGVVGSVYSLPVIELNGESKIGISFDEMSHNTHLYNYKLVHCNADWTESSISTSEFLSGFPGANITDVQSSVNTTILYTHYAFSLPNDDVSFKLSGNYVVRIYEDNNNDFPIAQACFSVVEPKVGITASVRANTDVELSGSLQQVEFDVDLKGTQIQDPLSELKVNVRQNNRIDTEVKDLKPTYILADKLSFKNNKSLIFEGGVEYHRFDISSVYAASQGIDGIRYNRNYYDVYLTPGKINLSKAYNPDRDVNGKFIINLQNSDADSVEADYMMVHFALPMDTPFLDGRMYIGGEYNYNLMDEVSRLDIDADGKGYSKNLLLKQGGYNYQYWFLPKDKNKATLKKVEGSYWQTKNEYTIYVYYRGWGERYDKLIGMKDFE